MKRRVSQYTQLRNAKAEIVELKKKADQLDEIHSFFDNMPIAMEDKSMLLGHRGQSVTTRLAIYLAHARR